MRNRTPRKKFRAALISTPSVAIGASDHHIHEPSRNDDDFFDRLPAHELLHAGIGEHERFDRFAVGIAWDAHVAAFFSIHLYDELELIRDQRGGIVLGPCRS